MSSDLSLRPAAVEAFELSAPLATPRRNAFGAMTRRPALLVRLADADGGRGWGEAFCNWPPFAARHRRRIVEELLRPRLAGAEFASPPALWEALTRAFRPMALQAGEPGPFEQAIAAIDIAAWDLVARRAGLPLHALLSSDGRPAPVYASALTAETIDALVPPLADAGWRGFKLKVGLGRDADLAALERLRRLVGSDAAVMADANQRWGVREAAASGRALAAFDLSWLEEPIAADAPDRAWRALARAQPTPLAAGENLRGLRAFRASIRSRALRVVQPDPIKWGGVSQMAAVAAAADGSGVAFCPHYLGGGVGLVATAHVATAMKAPWLEVDVTENPLREALAGRAFSVAEGRAVLSDAPGLGVDPEPEALRAFAA